MRDPVGRGIAVAIGLAAIGCGLVAGLDDFQECVGQGCPATDAATADEAADAADAADAAVPPTSCAKSTASSGNGLNNCGSGIESCCTSLTVTGGTYNRFYTNNGNGPTGVADPASVSDFRLDKYEVTVARFRRFVAAWSGGSGWTPPAASGKHTHLNGGMGLAALGGGYEPGWSTSDNGKIAPTDANLTVNVDATWTPSPLNEKLPITCVSWYEAAAFCIWDGGFLPSEAEWEYAAAGGSEEREYPWGTAAPGTSNMYAIYGCYYPSGSSSCSGVSSIAPVGTAFAGVGKYGQLDQAASVTEWVLDSWAGLAPSICTDCTNATSTSLRVGRGGSYHNPALVNLTPPYRTSATPTLRYADVGFRCARTP